MQYIYYCHATNSTFNINSLSQHFAAIEEFFIRFDFTNKSIGKNSRILDKFHRSLSEMMFYSLYQALLSFPSYDWFLIICNYCGMVTERVPIDNFMVSRLGCSSLYLPFQLTLTLLTYRSAQRINCEKQNYIHMT